MADPRPCILLIVASHHLHLVLCHVPVKEPPKILTGLSSHVILNFACVHLKQCQFNSCGRRKLYYLSLVTVQYKLGQIYASIAAFSSVQSLSHVRLCNTMDYSTPGLPVHHQLPEFTQTHVHLVGDAIQPSHPLSSPSPAFNLSQHQGLFK